jgi:hypothetical protein
MARSSSKSSCSTHLSVNSNFLHTSNDLIRRAPSMGIILASFRIPSSHKIPCSANGPQTSGQQANARAIRHPIRRSKFALIDLWPNNTHELANSIRETDSKSSASGTMSGADSLRPHESEERLGASSCDHDEDVFSHFLLHCDEQDIADYLRYFHFILLANKGVKKNMETYVQAQLSKR